MTDPGDAYFAIAPFERPGGVFAGPSCKKRWISPLKKLRLAMALGFSPTRVAHLRTVTLIRPFPLVRFFDRSFSLTTGRRLLGTVKK